MIDRRALILGTIALATLGTSTPAQARRFRLPIGAGLRAARKTYSVNHLTQAQLERCLVQGRELDYSEAALTLREGELSGRQAELERLLERLEAEGRLVDQYSQSSVDRYNALVAQYETSRGGFNEAIDQHNAGLRDLNSAVASYNASCADRLYYEDDMVAARLAAGVPN